MMSGLPSFHDSHWAAVTPPGSPYPTLKGEIAADTAVIGAGFTGHDTHVVHFFDEE